MSSLPNPLMARLAEVRKSGDVAKLAEAIPYARWMRIAPENGTGELLTRMRYHDDLVGNTFLPAIHGGTLGAMRNVRYPVPAPMSATTSVAFNPMLSTIACGFSSASRSGRSSQSAPRWLMKCAISRPM